MSVIEPSSSGSLPTFAVVAELMAAAFSSSVWGSRTGPPLFTSCIH